MRTSSIFSLLACLLAFMGHGFAENGRIEKCETQWMQFGVGLRTALYSEFDLPRDDEDVLDVDLSSIRLYISGQVHQYFQFEFNTERNENGDVKILDGIAKLFVSDQFQVWAGRFLPPSDRSNLSGPYYLGSWDFPMTQRYPAIVAGRDEGLAFWGQTGQGRFKYQVGIFEGREALQGSDEPLLAGRLTYNFWDKEPGYYNSSTYFGEKNILALGLAAMSQRGAYGENQETADFTGWNLDLLCERELAGKGVATLEGAYYEYESEHLSPGQDGDAYFTTLGYMFPKPIGIGKVKTLARFQVYHGVSYDERREELGVDYIIKDHNLRLSLVFAKNKTNSLNDGKVFRLGFQMQL